METNNLVNTETTCLVCLVCSVCLECPLWVCPPWECLSPCNSLLWCPLIWCLSNKYTLPLAKLPLVCNLKTSNNNNKDLINNKETITDLKVLDKTTTKTKTDNILKVKTNKDNNTKDPNNNSNNKKNLNKENNLKNTYLKYNLN